MWVAVEEEENSPKIPNENHLQAEAEAEATAKPYDNHTAIIVVL